MEKIGSRSRIRITAKKRAVEIYSDKPAEFSAFQSSGNKEETSGRKEKRDRQRVTH
jgi:hypothetical protein